MGDPDLLDGELELVRHQNLCLGLGRHLLDEHKTPEAELCCTDLVIEVLGISEPAILRVAADTRFADRHAGVGTFELPSLMKKWYNVDQSIPVDDRVRAVSNRVRRLYADILGYERGKLHPNPVKISMGAFADTLERKYGKDANRKSPRRFIRYLRSSDGRSDLKIFDLAALLRNTALLRPRSERQLVKSLCAPILDDTMRLAIRWQDEFDRYTPQFIEIVVPGTSVRIKVCLEHTDHPDRVSVARRFGADVIVVQNSRGQIQIFTAFRHNAAKEYRPYLTLAKLAAELRKRELHRRGKPVFFFSDEMWESSGKLPEVLQWFYLKHGELLLNGSNQSSTDVEPTVISDREVLHLIKEHIALSPDFDNPEFKGAVQYDDAVDPEDKEVDEEEAELVQAKAAAGTEAD